MNSQAYDTFFASSQNISLEHDIFLKLINYATFFSPFWYNVRVLVELKIVQYPAYHPIAITVGEDWVEN